MTHELFMKIVKEEIEAGAGQNVAKVELVENALHQLSILDDTRFNTQIEKYRSKKEEIIKKQVAINEEFSRLVDEYYDALMKGL